ncbi:hypothetical protein [Paenibacillus sp. FSL E2-0201]|uniref:hypothetical protein n=1 Tax=Paenibacillus sp. FSL E2-0201 TaxID=2954726 RepID=UPI0030DA64FD
MPERSTPPKPGATKTSDMPLGGIRARKMKMITAIGNGREIWLCTKSFSSRMGR